LADEGDYSADYWGRNIVSPVLFMPALNELIAQGCGVFLEISPHPVLSRSIIDCLKQAGGHGEVLASLRREREERLSLLEAAGRLYTLGFNLNWEHLQPASGHCVPLPTYHWQRKRYWIASEGLSSSHLGRRVPPTSEATVPVEEVVDREQKSSPPANSHALRAQLRLAELNQRRPLLKEYLVQEIVQVLGLDSMAALAGQKMLVELGMDSMMALELRNRFESDLGCSFSATIAFDYPTLDALLEHLVNELSTQGFSFRF
jgi:acyl transferase domain-containing protein